MVSLKAPQNPGLAICLFLFVCFSMAAWGAGPWSVKALSRLPQTIRS
jgi:hypothetical protein